MFLVTTFVLAAFSTMMFAGMADARTRFRRFEQEMDAAFPPVSHERSTVEALPSEAAFEQGDAREATSFTSSLLSAMQVHSQWGHNSPQISSEETSVSVEAEVSNCVLSD